jgi:hypothetical protein
MEDAGRGAFATLWASSRLYGWEGSRFAVPMKIRRPGETQEKTALPERKRAVTASQAENLSLAILVIGAINNPAQKADHLPRGRRNHEFDF